MPPDSATTSPDARIGAYLFDLDGTLVDTESLWTRATVSLLRSHGKTVDDAQASAWVLGRAWHDIYADIVATWHDLNVGADRLGEELRPHFLTQRQSHDIRIHSSVELLRQLAAHTPVAIVSGSPRREIAEAIDHMGIGPLLAFYLGSSDYAPGKPDPACFLTAAQRLNCPPARCVVFEDSAAGVRAARRAGMSVVALARPEAPRQDIATADWIVSDLSLYTPQGLFDNAAERRRP